ncbi:hypothetical protein XI03_31175 [Bradyrhizobium sp. CCBAU 65884]|uniref:bifunctional DNA primase/polymerase n=1 Tax=Bradyrhizobium sp. CCBAU 65884 TaxID=722477 RepID=UPI0023054F9D|nr:bifunctional DNA primase/polymerase [Bradyrhizobium sp. CCBAU 65884]MDA9478874.1 hypothetical protein [Bradyrhizobium sp. CCBAU 65884]
MSSPQQFTEPTLDIALSNLPRVSAGHSSPSSILTGVRRESFLRDLLAPILSNGYRCIPILPGQKRTSLRGWSKFCSEQPTIKQAAAWIERHPDYGIGIACGWSCVGIDIDESDPSKASEVEDLVCARLGVTPLKRIGLAPRAILVFRVGAGAIIPSRHVGKVDIIGDGTYFVGYGIHPGTGHPYAWPVDSPLTTKISNLPSVTQAQIGHLIEALSDYYRIADHVTDHDQQTGHAAPVRLRTISRSDAHWIYNNRGQVIDGRDSFLTAKIYQAYANGASTANAIADQAWSLFVAGADLTRPKRDGKRPWQKTDALAKAAYLLRSGKTRPAAAIVSTTSSGNIVAWSSDDLERFIQSVNAAGAAGELSPTQVSISHAMTEFARHKNDCFASCETIANAVGCKPNTVKKARRRLRTLGFWTSQQCRGGKGFIAHYRPNPASVDRSDLFSVYHNLVSKEATS